MPNRRCRKCKTEKVSAPRFGTFVGDPKNFKKTGMGQRTLSLGTPQTLASKETASSPDRKTTDDLPDVS